MMWGVLLLVVSLLAASAHAAAPKGGAISATQCLSNATAGIYFIHCIIIS